MHFSFLLPVAAIAALAAAAPSELKARGGSSSECDTGSISCCQTYYNSDSEVITSLSSLLDLALGDVDGQVGVGCSPASGVGVGNTGSTCTQEPVCCNGNYFSGLIVVGCSPININL